MLFFVVLALVVVCVIELVECQQTCSSAHGSTGNCAALADCKGTGWASNCPGTDRCCTLEPCYSAGRRGECRTSTACDDAGAGFVGEPQFCLGMVPDGSTSVCCVPAQTSVADCTNGATPTGHAIPILASSSYFYWGEAVADNNVEYCGPSEQGQTACSTEVVPFSSAQVRWAEPGNSVTVPPGADIFLYKSGLGFESTLPDQVFVDQDFQLGVFTHYNFVVRGSIPPSATLHLRIDIPGATFVSNKNEFQWTMQIDETDNTGTTPCTYPSVVRCADKIDFPDSGFDLSNAAQLETVDFTVSGSNIKYTMALMGFRREACVGQLLDEFVTQERVVNQAVLYARITEGCPVIECTGDLEIVAGQCRCSVPFTRSPTPVPPTPAPTPMPTPPPTPNPPGCSAWGTASPCSAECGEGTQTRTRVTPMPSCEVNEETFPCRLRPCTESPTPVPPTPFPETTPVVVEFENEGLSPAIIGVIAAASALFAIFVIAAIIFAARSASSVTPYAQKPDNNNVVEGNPLYNQQTQTSYNPIFQKTGGT